MKIISFSVLAASAVFADRDNRKSLQVSQQVNRDLALCGHWRKEGRTLKGSGSLDYFGSAVATSRDGSTIAVSAPSTEHEGYVKVFFDDPLTKTKQMLGNKIMPKNRQGESIGAAALSLSDNGRVLAIANVENKNPSGVKSMSGGVSVYALNENTNVWDQVGQLEPIYGGHFQTTASVSIAGDGLSYVFSSSGSAVGVHAKSRVYYFDRIESEWKPKGSMINEKTDGSFVSDEASVSMSRDGHTIAIGSSRNSNEAKNAGERYHGRVRVLSFVGGEWVKLGSDIYGTQGFSYFGKSISLDEDGLILAVGAEGTNFNMGEVKVFKYGSEEWVQVGSDIPGPSKDSYFGSSIALSSSEDGLLVAAGAYGAGLSGSASIYQFKEGPGDWQQLGESINDVGGSAFLGASIAMSRSGKTVVIGSPLSDYNGATSGSAYVYDLSEVTCSPTVAPTDQPSVSSLPTVTASAEPSTSASFQPSSLPTETNSAPPSASAMPTSSPSETPSLLPSVGPTNLPSRVPTASPSAMPTSSPSETPSLLPSVGPTNLPSRVPTASPYPSTIPSKVSTNIAGLNSDGILHMSKSTNTNKATSAFIISVFAAVFFSFA